MKSRAFVCIAAMTLFAILDSPVRLAAQKQTTHFRHYKLIDIGTLGGTFSEAVGISNTGAAAGNSTPPGDSVVHASLWQNGVITDLGRLGGPNSNVREAEPQPNEKGEVAGASDTTTLDSNVSAGEVSTSTSSRLTQTKLTKLYP